MKVGYVGKWQGEIRVEEPFTGVSPTTSASASPAGCEKAARDSVNDAGRNICGQVLDAGVHRSACSGCSGGRCGAGWRELGRASAGRRRHSSLFSRHTLQLHATAQPSPLPLLSSSDSVSCSSVGISHNIGWAEISQCRGSPRRTRQSWSASLEPP